MKVKVQPTDVHGDTVERAQEISPAVGTQAFEALRILQIRYEVEQIKRKVDTANLFLR